MRLTSLTAIATRQAETPMTSADLALGSCSDSLGSAARFPALRRDRQQVEDGPPDGVAAEEREPAARLPRPDASADEAECTHPLGDYLARHARCGKVAELQRAVQTE